MNKFRKFIQDYRDKGEADVEVSFSMWHIIIPIALIIFAIIIFS